MIVRLVKSSESHHVLAQDDKGRIVHKKFKSEASARKFIDERWNLKVTEIDLDNHLLQITTRAEREESVGEGIPTTNY